MQKFITTLSFLSFATISSLSLANPTQLTGSPTDQIQQLNAQIQGQLKQIQDLQQKQMQTLNNQLQTQIKQIQVALEAQIQKVNGQAQSQIQQTQASLQQQIKQVQQELVQLKK